MPQRFAQGAESIGPDPGSPSIPKTNAQLLTAGSVPEVLTSVLKALGLDDPLGVGQGSVQRPGAVLASGKSLPDLLGEVFTAPGAKKFGRVRLTSYDPQQGTASFNNVKTGQALESSMAEADKLYRSGALMREGPPTEGMSVEQLVRRLLKYVKE